MKTEFKLKSGNILRIMPDEYPINPRLEWDNLGTMVCWHNNYNLGDNSVTGKDARNKFEPEFKDSTEMFCKLSKLSIDLDELDGDEYTTAYAKIKEAAYTNAVILPLRLYDHSGISMSIGSGAHEHDPGGWDSGQVGWIYMTYKESLKQFKVDENNTVEEWHGPNKGQRIPIAKMIYRCLEGEVETYNQYLTGDVYGFETIKIVTTDWVNVRDPEDKKTTTEEEVTDSCWGFFGDDFKTNGILDYINDEVLEEIVN